ncbi:hypothetical protein SEA_PEPE25_3 [Microbacterium phage Pepe25]|nr:hypothetical protein SEA_PEPE25_3 [Microbacterium phage Pepe25]
MSEQQRRRFDWSAFWLGGLVFVIAMRLETLIWRWWG